MSNRTIPTPDAFRTKLGVIIATGSTFFKQLTEASVDAMHRYHAEGHTDYIVEVYEMCQNEAMPRDAMDSFDKLVYSTSNVHIKVLEESPFTVTAKAKGDNPAGWNELLDTIETEGIRTLLGKNKSGSRAKRTNQRGAKSVTSVKSKADSVSKEAYAKLTAERQAAVDKLTEQHNANLKLVMDGKPIPGSDGGGSGALPDLGTPELNTALAEVIDLAVEVIATPAPEGEKSAAERVAGALKGVKNQLETAKGALVHLASKSHAA
jgi:hypothetical protein